MKILEEKNVSVKVIRRKTLLAFAFFFIFIFSLLFGWNWLHQQPKDDGAYRPLRKVLNANEKVFGAVFSNDHLSKTFSKSDVVKKTKVNGGEGMGDDFNAVNWKLKLIRHPGDTLLITLDEIKTLPKTEVIFDFKCIEGWSQVTHWGGVKFSDFVKRFGLTQESELAYVGLSTPDNGYYVGIDRKSMLHPQTILCYEMNNEPLPFDQGYPLRLIIPVKYGIKHLKRIGNITFSNVRPPDFWFERGYDYYSGL